MLHPFPVFAPSSSQQAIITLYRGLTIPGPILELATISVAARLVLAEAYDLLHLLGNASATNAYYAVRLHLPRRRVQKSLAELERAGYVVRHYTLSPVRQRLLVFTFPADLPTPSTLPMAA